MVKTREGYKLVVSKTALYRIENGLCPVCEKPKTDWTRRTDWRCCSVECTTRYWTESVLAFGWTDLRLRAFERDKHKCVKCGKESKAEGLVGDHIIPIALGGEEWDINNVQTLCIDCNRIKTKEDAGRIAKLRRVEKNQKLGQTTLQ